MQPDWEYPMPPLPAATSAWLTRIGVAAIPRPWLAPLASLWLGPGVSMWIARVQHDADGQLQDRLSFVSRVQAFVSLRAFPNNTVEPSCGESTGPGTISGEGLVGPTVRLRRWGR